MGFLRTAFDAACRIHSRPFTHYRLGGTAPTIYEKIRATPSNFFRYAAGPSETVVPGFEFIIPISTMSGTQAELVSLSGSSIPTIVNLTWDTLTGPITTSGSAVTKNSGGQGWDNLALSNMTLTGNGKVRFKANDNLGAFGFAMGDPNTPGTFQQAFSAGHFNLSDPTAVSVYDGAFPIVDLPVNSTPTDVFEFEAISGVVTLKLNGTLIYTFSGNATGQTLIPFVTVFDQAQGISHSETDVTPVATFTLTYGTQTTSSIDWLTATASQVQTALRLLPGLSAVDVSGDVAVGFIVTMYGVNSPTMLSGSASAGCTIAVTLSQSIPFSPVIKRGDRLLDEAINKLYTIQEVEPITDLGGDYLAYRVRTET